MTTLLIGHRGAGKSTLLKHIPGPTFDLDDEITKHSGRAPTEWIAISEARFREVEGETLNNLIRLGGVIAVGAGCENLPPELHKIWIRRVTDNQGRAFLNRPRLEPELSPLAEYFKRFEIREKRFRAWAHEELVLPEGEVDGMEFFFSKRLTINGELTVLPRDFRDWKSFVARRSPRHFELREDLLNAGQIELALGTLPNEKILFSIRNRSYPPPEVKTDWALELGPPEGSHYYSVSLHDRDGSLRDCFARFPRGPIQKLAVEIQSYKELLEGHRWFLDSPKTRAFLPRSVDGRWRGYRSLFGPRMPLHFVREGEGSSLDQPFLWQARLQTPLNKNFAAVLGDPIEHSRSPREHRDLGLPFVAFKVTEKDFSEALEVLRALGLRYVAVTSPLKTCAFAAATHRTREAELTQAANTLDLSHDGEIRAHNTDLLALQSWAEELPHGETWIWGGGGLRETLRAVWPEAIRIGARGGVTPKTQPKLVLWAVGRSRAAKLPAADLRPGLIADLNYGDDSPGLEWAVGAGLPYQSGLKMFKLQAAFQRRFWKGP